MRARAHVTLAAGMLGLAALACRGGPRTTTFDASDVDASAEAAKLGAILPAALGPFTATDPPMMVTGSGLLIEAHRSYADTAGKKVEVELSTGDVRSQLGTIESNDEHAFGSDSPTYWRTTSIAGHRARIAEERPVVHTSECLVRVEPNHVATVRVHPAAPGECAAVAALLDFKAIVASGGVPSPPTDRR
ncbi:MAG TPA: hypothetical protein VGH87_05300 [Polyangiaceae bacterium]|jgi:hypothetical protein